MIYRIAVQTAEMAGIAVPRQYIAAEVFIAKQPADGAAVDHNCGMLLNQCNRELQVDLLMPAAAFVTMAAHQNHSLGRRNEG